MSSQGEDMSEQTLSTESAIAVSVRELVEFVRLSGDLVRGVGFVGHTGMDVAHEGTKGHQEIQSSRPDNYEAEVYLSHVIETNGLSLKVRGRVDGIWHQDDGSFLIEEIKTFSGRREIEPNPLHWGQGKVYGHMYLQKRLAEDPEWLPPESVHIQLTYLNRKTRQITSFDEYFTREELAAHFHELCDLYCEWARRQREWLLSRNRSIEALDFPYPSYRAGQRDLAVAVYRAIAGPHSLFAEAPTGIGKTMAAIFPALKAVGKGFADKIFYLTARTTGRTVAEKAFADLHERGLDFRTLTLTARDKICFVEDEPPCDTSVCPFAIGYYDRIKDALQDAFSHKSLDRTTIEALARKHSVCPFELSMDVSSWCDAIICDYNYAFDPNAQLRRYFAEDNGTFVLLIDEAHNLVDRARSMYSASLDKRTFLDIRKAIKDKQPKCGKLLFNLNKHFVRWDKALAAAKGGDQEALFALQEEAQQELEGPETQQSGPQLRQSAGETGLLLEKAPKGFVKQLGALMDEIEAIMPHMEEGPEQGMLLDLYFQARGFVRTASFFDERYTALFKKTKQNARIMLRCLDPSQLLLEARKQAVTTIFFSATLQPLDYFQQLLGVQEEDTALRLSSPFPQEHLQLYVEDRIGTTYRERDRTYQDVARAILTMFGQHRGNTLVFFPSYRYMREVFAQVQEQLPEWIEVIPDGELLLQVPRMTEAERDAYLDAFDQKDDTPRLGFAVMGGIFGEGIDLVGDRLQNVVIVGVGLPQVCLERDLIRDHFQEQHGVGFDYAYSFPGMNKVLQAVGRLIRTEDDKGAALLIDKRFGQRRYRRLFPPWWTPQRASQALHTPQAQTPPTLPEAKTPEKST